MVSNDLIIPSASNIDNILEIECANCHNHASIIAAEAAPGKLLASLQLLISH